MGTQKQLADALGKSSSWVSRLESGLMKEIPQPSDLQKISEVLGVSQSEMLAAEGYDVETGNEGDTPAVATVRAILGNREYSERQLEKLDQFFRSTLEIIEGMEE